MRPLRTTTDQANGIIVRDQKMPDSLLRVWSHVAKIPTQSFPGKKVNARFQNAFAGGGGLAVNRGR
jgi:hypothetical protein